MLPTKSFISTNNNNNITDIITNTTNNSSSSVSFQAKRKPKMETNNINKPHMLSHYKNINFEYNLSDV